MNTIWVNFSSILPITFLITETLNCKMWTDPGIPQTQGCLICRQVNDGKIYAISSRQVKPSHKPTTQTENEVWVYDIGMILF